MRTFEMPAIKIPNYSAFLHQGYIPDEALSHCSLLITADTLYIIAPTPTNAMHGLVHRPVEVTDLSCKSFLAYSTSSLTIFWDPCFGRSPVYSRLMGLNMDF
jgi:hypothetical protein